MKIYFTAKETNLSECARKKDKETLTADIIQAIDGNKSSSKRHNVTVISSDQGRKKSDHCEKHSKTSDNNEGTDNQQHKEKPEVSQEKNISSSNECLIFVVDKCHCSDRVDLSSRPASVSARSSGSNVSPSPSDESEEIVQKLPPPYNLKNAEYEEVYMNSVLCLVQSSLQIDDVKEMVGLLNHYYKSFTEYLHLDINKTHKTKYAKSIEEILVGVQAKLFDNTNSEVYKKYAIEILNADLEENKHFLFAHLEYLPKRRDDHNWMKSFIETITLKNALMIQNEDPTNSVNLVTNIEIQRERNLQDYQNAYNLSRAEEHLKDFQQNRSTTQNNPTAPSNSTIQNNSTVQSNSTIQSNSTKQNNPTTQNDSTTIMANKSKIPTKTVESSQMNRQVKTKITKRRASSYVPTHTDVESTSEQQAMLLRQSQSYNNYPLSNTSNNTVPRFMNVNYPPIGIPSNCVSGQNVILPPPSYLPNHLDRTRVVAPTNPYQIQTEQNYSNGLSLLQNKINNVGPKITNLPYQTDYDGRIANQYQHGYNYPLQIPQVAVSNSLSPANLNLRPQEIPTSNGINLQATNGAQNVNFPGNFIPTAFQQPIDPQSKINVHVPTTSIYNNNHVGSRVDTRLTGLPAKDFTPTTIRQTEQPPLVQPWVQTTSALAANVSKNVERMGVPERMPIRSVPKCTKNIVKNNKKKFANKPPISQCNQISFTQDNHLKQNGVPPTINISTLGDMQVWTIPRLPQNQETVSVKKNCDINFQSGTAKFSDLVQAEALNLQKSNRHEDVPEKMPKLGFNLKIANSSLGEEEDRNRTPQTSNNDQVGNSLIILNNIYNQINNKVFSLDLNDSFIILTYGNAILNIF